MPSSLFDSTCDEFRLEESKKALSHILEIIKPSIPLILIANKQDLPQPRPLTEFQLMLKSFNLKDRAFITLGVNSLLGLGVREAMDWLIETIVERKVA